ncbi:right-handed parallel beta-helix repeat-containing protein [Kiritimatiellota bacterium B12222]|nr:right-handed parallel beta-helix repeat-containing protein [Kiritimatiellota bacterium B12222]
MKKFLFYAPLLLLVFATLSFAQENLVPNGDFASWQDGKPAHWSIWTKGQEITQSEGPSAGSSSLKITLKKAYGKKSGEIIQRIPVKPDTRYRLSAQVKGDGKGILQVKRLSGKKELSRHSSKGNKGDSWSEVYVNVNSGNADQLMVQMRWNQETENLNKSVEFANLQLVELGDMTHTGEEVPPRVVATYNSLSLYWKPTGGTAKKAVTTHYRKVGQTEWKEALPLWFDDMQHPGSTEQHTAEYRGSIVLLDANTAYEVKLKLQDGPERIIKAHTRSDHFKIARTVTLPASQSETYLITEGGSATDGYVKYVMAPGAVWDLKDSATSNIVVDASYVILSGLTLKGATTHGIVLKEVQDVVIENCDISGWGETRDSGQAKNLNAAIYARAKSLERITIQNNDLHHPRSDSNSWNQKRPGSNSSHPEGPQGIVFFSGQGGHVIRFNRIYSDLDHMFNDGMGEVHNFSYGGFPVKDSDIHDNYVSHCWDDGLEIEGANMNVRVYNNYIHETYGAIGAAAPSLGPMYIFRNVYAVSRKHNGTEPNDYRGHYLVKLGNEKPQWTHGRMYIFHNTNLQPPAFEGFSDATSGAQSGIVFTSNKKTQQNIVSRNNLLDLRKPSDWAIRDTQKTINNDFDYDMHDGKTLYKEGSGANNIISGPSYQRRSDGQLELKPGSPGHDAGIPIPNFNDGYVGEAPDIGAVETGSQSPRPKLWPEFPPFLGENE